MTQFKRQTPWDKEWKDLEKKELKFIAKRKEGPTSTLINKLDRFVPQKLNETLDKARFIHIGRSTCRLCALHFYWLPLRQLPHSFQPGQFRAVYGIYRLAVEQCIRIGV